MVRKSKKYVVESNLVLSLVRQGFLLDYFPPFTHTHCVDIKKVPGVSSCRSVHVRILLIRIYDAHC